MVFGWPKQIFKLNHILQLYLCLQIGVSRVTFCDDPKGNDHAFAAVPSRGWHTLCSPRESWRLPGTFRGNLWHLKLDCIIFESLKYFSLPSLSNRQHFGQLDLILFSLYSFSLKMILPCHLKISLCTVFQMALVEVHPEGRSSLETPRTSKKVAVVLQGVKLKGRRKNQDSTVDTFEYFYSKHGLITWPHSELAKVIHDLEKPFSLLGRSLHG